MAPLVLIGIRPRRKWRWATRATSLVAVLLLVSCQRQIPGEWARVIAVRDGDTIELDDGRIVRYIGLDTPERGRPGSDSATALNDRLVMGKRVRLEFGGEQTDRYGRTLAFVYCNERMVNREIVRVGWAWCYFYPDNLQHAPELVRDLREAMSARRGLWRETSVETADEYIASFAGFRFHRPDCSSVQGIKRPDEVRFTARDSAFFDGYSPCERCEP
ncbi:MAG: thermonuclease family protein [Candidatus Zixiibacteriota bacterium]